MIEFHLSVPADSRFCPKNVSEAVVKWCHRQILFRNIRQIPKPKEDLPEEEMATHSHIPAWEIPWTEEPGGLQSMGLQRVGHDRALTHTHAT